MNKLYCSNNVTSYHTYIFLFNTQGLVPQFRPLDHFHRRHQGHKIKILYSVLCNTNADSNTSFYVKNFDDQKFKNPHSWKNLQFIYPSASVMGVQVTGAAFSPQKKNIQHFKMKFFNVFLFLCVYVFCSPESGSSRPKPMRIHADSDPQHLLFFIVKCFLILPVHRNNLCPSEQWPSRDFHSLLWLWKNKF